jgi:large subunit ribosomal protein L28
LHSLKEKHNRIIHHIIEVEMSKVCQILGKKTISGHNVSHSNIKTKRKFKPNLHTKRFFIPEEGQWITLKVSAKGVRHITKKGITACLIEALDKGHIK